MWNRLLPPFALCGLIAFGQEAGAANARRSPPVKRITTTVPAAPIESVDPEYTEEARIAGIEGEVDLEFMIGEDGRAHEIHVEQSLGFGLDEKAVEAVERSRFPARKDAGDAATITAFFRLPENQSRWHLLHAEFHPDTDVSRPVFTKTKYPLGAGIGREVIDEGHIMEAIPRLATVRLAFVVDPNGVPTHFEIREASDPVWGPDAVLMVSGWQFSPGMKYGAPVPVECVIDLAWGPKDLPRQ